MGIKVVYRVKEIDIYSVGYREKGVSQKTGRRAILQKWQLEEVVNI
jgi:hypothetical protein